MPDRPFKILGLQQIAVGGLDKAALRTFWIDTLGLEAIFFGAGQREMRATPVAPGSQRACRTLAPCGHQAYASAYAR